MEYGEAARSGESDPETIVAALAVHPRAAAASRLRLLQFTDALAERGISLRFWSYIDDVDEAAWLTAPWWRRLSIASRGLLRLRRIPATVRGARVVIVQREVVPFGPAVIEALVARKRKLVWDVDDALWQYHTSIDWLPRWLRSPSDKYRRLATAADEIWAGSDVLTEWCRGHNDSVWLVPTVVDVPASPPDGNRGPTVAWIGTATTAPFVEKVLPALLSLENPPRVVVVGGRPRIPEGLDATVLDWSLDTEHRVLSEAKVGLYPIDRDHPLAEGKCGLKAVLYMAHGVVPVVTATTTNAKVVTDGVHGRHARDDDWPRVVEELLADDHQWRRLRDAGHERVLNEYSVRAWAPFIVGRLRHLVDDSAE